MGEHWRVGRSLGRTLYIGDRLVGLMDTPELAEQVVAAMHASAAELRRQEAARRAAEQRDGEPRTFRFADLDMPQAPDDVVIVRGRGDELWRRQPDGLWLDDRVGTHAGSWYNLLRVCGPVTEVNPAEAPPAPKRRPGRTTRTVTS